MNKKILGWAIFLVIVLVIIILVVLLPGAPSRSKTLKLGIRVWPGFGPYYIAQEKNFFSNYDTEVEIVIIEPTNLKSVLSSGEVDAISMPPDIVPILSDADMNVKIIGATDMSSGGDGLVAIEEIKSVSDLKERNVAVEVGSPSHFFLLTLLDEAGLSSSDIGIDNMAAPDAGAAFVAGQVDIAVTWEPWLYQASQREGGHVIKTTADYPILPSVIIAKDSTVENERKELEGLMKGFYDGLAFVEENPIEAYEIMSNVYEVSVDEFKEIKMGFTWFDYNDSLDYFGTESNPGKIYEVINNASKFWLNEEFIQNGVDAKDVVDIELLKNLY